MATEDAVIGRRVSADARVSNAVRTLADRHGVEAAAMPSLPREVSPDFRAMIEREVLADTLERLAGAEAPPSLDSQLLEVAIGMLAGTAKISIEEAAEQIAQANDVIHADEAETKSVPDLSAMTRDELDVMATDLGVDAPDKLPNKAAVIDAITAAPGQ